MAHSKEEIEKIGDLLSEGLTQREVADQTGVPERTIRDLKSKGKLDVGAQSQANTASLPAEIEDRRPRRITTAAEIVAAGFDPSAAPLILASLRISKARGDRRLQTFLSGLFEARQAWPEIPEPWSAAIAGFPIIARDINSPAFDQLAAQARELHPYLGRGLRRAYLRRGRVLTTRILRDVAECLRISVFGLASGSSGGAIPAGPRHLIVTGPNDVMDEMSLERIVVPGEPAMESEDPPGTSDWQRVIEMPGAETKYDRPVPGWPELLFDITSRLPEVDRQQGDGGRFPLTLLLLYWCSLIGDDMEPPLAQANSATGQPLRTATS